MPAENWKFETNCPQILSLDILQLCNVMLLVDGYKKMFFYFIVWTQKRMTFFHVYMTTSVSAHDTIQITLNDYSSSY